MAIEIRPFEQSDAKAVFEYSSDFENTKYLLSPPFSSLAEAEAFIERRREEYKEPRPAYVAFAITSDGQLVGDVFATLDGDKAIIGGVISKKYWGQGCAAESGRLMEKLLVNRYGVKELVAYCDNRNFASQRVIKKLGMSFAGQNGVRNYNTDVTDGIELKYTKTLSEV